MKKIKNAALVLGLGAMALSVSGCGKSSKLSLNLSTTEGVENVERHQELQFKLDVEGKAKDKIEYVVTGAADIDENGLLKVHDDAVVGSTIEVVAKSGKHESNKITLSVKDTAAASISVLPSAYALQSDNQITFTVNYTPSYTTLTEYNVAITKGSEYAVLEEGVLKLKSGVSVEDNRFEKVEVTISMANDATVKKAVSIGIGTFFEYMLVEDLNYVVGRDANKKVIPVVSDENGVPMEDIPAGSFTFTSKNPEIFEIDPVSGVIAPKGHGKGVVDVQLGTTHVEAYVYVMIAPETLKIKGLNEVTEDVTKGFHFSNKESFKLEAETTKGSYSTVSDKTKVLFEKLDDNNIPVAEGDSVAVIDSDSNVTFKTTGKIRVTVSSDSSLNDEAIGSYEKTEAIIFHVNEGKNIRTQADLRNALGSEAIQELNFLNTVYFTDEETPVGNHHDGIDSYGSKYFYGNGYGISLEKLSFTHKGDEVRDNGSNLIAFMGDRNNPHSKFTVQFYEFSLIGNSNYEGLYTGESAASTGEKAYKEYTDTKGFNRTYSRGMFVGYNNYHDGFIKSDGTEKKGDTAEEFANAAVENFRMENVTIRGFHTGVRLSHCVGSTYGVHIYDSFNNGLELDQCILEMTNTKFGQVGGFTVEMTSDGVNNCKAVNEKLAAPCAGLDYNQKSQLVMKGTIETTNMNSGVSTTYMQVWGAEHSASVTMIINILCNAVADFVAASKGHAENASALEAFWPTVIFDESQQMNFFTLCNMGDVVMGSSQQTSDFYEFKEDTNNMVSMTEVLQGKETALETGGDFEDITKFQYIIIDLDLSALQMGYLGQVITLNRLYNPGK